MLQSKSVLVRQPKSIAESNNIAQLGLDAGLHPLTRVGPSFTGRRSEYMLCGIIKSYILTMFAALNQNVR